MAFRNLHHFIEILEREGELVRIKEYVNPHLEIAEITDRFSKTPHRNKALLFENNGTSFPLAINLMGSQKRMCMALGVNDMDEIGKELEGLFKSFMTPRDHIMDKLKLLPELGRLSSLMPKIRSGKGECQEVVMRDSDLTILPVMKCWPEDGGPFITLPIIHTKDPITGIRNVGLYRMQVFGPKLAALHWHRHKVSAGHFNEYKKLNKKMPVAVALGGDPVYTYCASAPLPPTIDEYILAGFLRKRPVELVKCLTVDMQVPTDADIVIEGYVDPNEEFILEGPFGDHTGYYSLADLYPRFHITCLTHKKNAIYPSTIVGIPPQEDAWIGKASERIFIIPMKMTVVPEVVDMDMPVEGIFHNINIVKIRKEFPGHAQKVMNAMWGAGQMMFNKILVIVDETIDIHNYLDVAKAISENTDPEKDIYFSQGPMDVLDHSCSKFSFGGKMCVDATRKLPEELTVSGLLHKYEGKKNLSPSPSARGGSASGRKGEELRVRSLFPEIINSNFNLLEKGISCIFVSVKKNRPGHIRELHEKLFQLPELQEIKFAIYVEHTIDVFDIPDVIWRLTNNMDAKRDCHLAPLPPLCPPKDGSASGGKERGGSHLGIDGTRKTKGFDGFDRQWPNIICSDETTIKSVDEKWNVLGLGELISSPSLKYRKQLYKGGAVVLEREP